jgi:hypothetical protein
MKYAIGMGSGAMIYTPSFIKIGSAIQKMIGRTHRHTDSCDYEEGRLLGYGAV